MIYGAVEVVSKSEVSQRMGKEVVDFLVEVLAKSNRCDCSRQIGEWAIEL